jgi:anti-sigma factor RsiW
MPQVDPPACRAVLDRLEAYVDGELPREAGAALERHVETCPTCSGELALARQIRSGLRELPQPRCPDRVAAAALDAAQLRSWSTVARGWLLAKRPLFALAAAGAAAAFVFVVVSRPEPALQHSPAEVARAEAEIRLALSYVARMNRLVGSSLRTEAVAPLLELPLELVAERLGEKSHEPTRGGRPCA